MSHDPSSFLPFVVCCYYLLLYARVTSSGAMLKQELRDKIHTIFYPGLGAPQQQAANYAGDHGVITSEGGHTICDNAPLILHNVRTCAEPPEIHYDCSWYPSSVLFRAAQKAYHAILYQDYAPRTYTINYSKVSVAGGKDVALHRSLVQQAVADAPHKRLVLFGTSKGAATTLVSMAGMPLELRAHIALVILEAPFDAVESLVRDTYGRWLGAGVLQFLTSCTSFQRNQTSPLTAADTFPLDIPVAFVTSEIDTVVPEAHTQPLIAKLHERKHPHLHELRLKHSHHKTLSRTHPEDTARYVNFVNNLYEKYIL